MNKFVSLLFLLCATNLKAQVIDWQENQFVSLCYHDVRKDIIGKLNTNQTALNTKYLINHFRWLQDNGYTVISTKMVRQAQKGEIILPKKSVLLTFDDGYKSFYRTIFPILKQFNYPATFAIVTNWIGNPKEQITYGSEKKYKADFMTWAQIKELSASPLIEIASHSHDLHKGIIANPQGNKQPAATSRKFNQHYESDEVYRKRIFNDLKKSYDLIKKHTGTAPKSLVWPYGSYSLEAWDIAKSIGFTTSFNLEEEITTIDSSKKDLHIPRFLISSNPSLNEFKDIFRQPKFIMPQRVVHVDLDYVYDKNKTQQNKNLDILLDRIKKLEISTVYLQAFADSDGDGNADAVYFPNTQLPMRADLFNRVAWQLRTRANVKVYAWMPISAIKIDAQLQQQLSVKSWQNGTIAVAKDAYTRLSIFQEKSQEIMLSLYASLAKYTKFSGILYHDDGFLSDFEDVGAEALAYYKEKGLEFSSVANLVQNKQLAPQWQKIKTKALIEFTNKLTQQVHYYQPTAKTARNIYAQVIINPASEQWFAQNLADFVNNYDTTAIMSMPYMEKAKTPSNWLENLANIINQSKLAKEKIVFELQTVDWNKKQKISTQELKQQFQILQQLDIMNYGYYPDDFIHNHPDLEAIYPEMSLADFPYYRR